MIDVIIPAYNCTSTLGTTLASLVAQTDKDFHVIVVDDCSTEDISSVVSGYTEQLHIQYIRNPKNVGCGMSRQAGIDCGKSSHFCFLDADDMFMPYTVEVFNAAIDDDPDLELLCGSFYEQAKVNGKHALILRKDGFTWCHGKLYCRRKVEQFGIRNRPDVKFADDSFFNSMCFELLYAKKMELPLYLYSNNPESVTRRKDDKRDSEVTVDFLRAMIASCEVVLRHKPYIEHLPHTLGIAKKMGRMTDEAVKLSAILESMCGGEKNYDRSNQNTVEFDTVAR